MVFAHEGLHEETFLDLLPHIFNARGFLSFTMLLVSGTDFAVPLTIDGVPFSPTEDSGAEEQGGDKPEDDESEKDEEENKKDADHEHHYIAYDYDYWEGYAIEKCNICGDRRIVHSV